jgi:bacillithiol synthase
VLLRPIVQDAIFPTICYVAGPNELAYLGQLREVYAHFGVAMPLMYQRATATLVDSATLRFLAKYAFPLEWRCSPRTRRP